MRTGVRTVTIACVVALASTACDGGAASDVSPQAPATTEVHALFSELLPLVLESDGRNLGIWHANPSRSALVYELRGPDENEIWAMDRRGTPWLVASQAEIDKIDFVGDDHLAILERRDGESRLHYASLDGSEVHQVAGSTEELRFIGLSTNELVYAQAGSDTTRFVAWDLDTRRPRDIGSYEQHQVDLWELLGVGDHIVFSVVGGDTGSVLAMSVADGTTVELPRHDPEFPSRIVGTAPNGQVVLTEGRPDGGYIYTVDPERPEEIADLTENAISEMVQLDGTIVDFVSTDGDARQIDLVTGAISDAADPNSKPPGLVTGLKENNLRLRGALDSGNWLVTGYLLGGVKYRTVWDFNDDFGGGDSVGDTDVVALFEYNPQTEDLWRISGPPTFAATQTASGSGVGPSGVLRVVVLDGFIVYTTGFSGAAYDIDYNLYAAPIPSLLDN